MHRWSMFGLALVAAVVVSACGGGGGSQPPSGSPPTGPTTGGATVTISEKEWTISGQPATIKTGSIKFVIKNEGTIEHNFVVKELNQELAASIQPGQSKDASVTLKPGTYTLICNIPGHEDAGMHTKLTVTE